MLCEMWSRPYAMHIQLRIFRLQYSSVGVCAAIVDITTVQCALYCKLGAKYSARSPVYAMWTVVPAIYKVLIAPHIQTSIFIWTYLRCYCTFHDEFNARCTANLVPNAAHTLQFTLSDLWSRPYTKYLQLRIFIPQYSAEGRSPAIGGISTIQRAFDWKLWAKYSAYPPVYAKVKCVPGHVQSIYSSAYLGFNIQV
jgi:hypothetical protein